LLETGKIKGTNLGHDLMIQVLNRQKQRSGH
jgi:hypothetical protein